MRVPSELRAPIEHTRAFQNLEQLLSATLVCIIHATFPRVGLGRVRSRARRTIKLRILEGLANLYAGPRRTACVCVYTINNNNNIIFSFIIVKIRTLFPATENPHPRNITAKVTSYTPPPRTPNASTMYRVALSYVQQLIIVPSFFLAPLFYLPNQTPVRLQPQ